MGFFDFLGSISQIPYQRGQQAYQRVVQTPISVTQVLPTMSLTRTVTQKPPPAATAAPTVYTGPRPPISAQGQPPTPGKTLFEQRVEQTRNIPVAGVTTTRFTPLVMPLLPPLTWFKPGVPGERRSLEITRRNPPVVNTKYR